MRAEGQNRVTYRFGRTDDIMKEVLETYRLYVRDCREFAEQFRRGTEEATAEAVFDYVVSKVDYKEDPAGQQWVKTPARLLSDGVGDCKSMAIFVASMLACLGIDCFFRFVSFRKGGNVTHVYVVTHSGIVIDPVERVNGKPVFNYAQNFVKKIDMEATTCISRLSGIENEDLKEFGVDTDGSGVLENTRAANYLYTAIDYRRTKLSYRRNLDDWRELDILIIALHLYQLSAGRRDLMHQAAGVLQWMMDSEYFTADSLDQTERGDNIARLLELAQEKLFDFGEIYLKGTLYSWFMHSVAEEDYNTVTRQEKEAYENGIGIGKFTKKDQEAIYSKIQESAPYFVYLYLPAAWVEENRRKYPQIYVKRKIEQKVFDSWVKGFASFTNKTTIYNLIQSGFLKSRHITMEEYIQMIVDSTKEQEVKAGIGIAAETVAAVVVAVASVVVAVLRLVQTWIEKAQAAGAANVDDYYQGMLSESDFTYSAKVEAEEKRKQTLPLLAAGAALLLLFRKKKKETKTQN